MGLDVLYLQFNSPGESVAVTVISLYEAAQLGFYLALRGYAHAVVQCFRPGVTCCLIS